jgi:hypothetical protein
MNHNLWLGISIGVIEIMWARHNDGEERESHREK